MFTQGGSFRGDYDQAVEYRVHDIVRYQGHAWQAVADGFMAVTPAEGAWWKKLANSPVYSGLAASTAEAASLITTGIASGTRKYWFGQEWVLEKPAPYSVRLKKVYQNCNCNCNCISACNCVANQPNEGNCSYDIGDGLACNCACLYQSNCNYSSGYCNCTSVCNDGNCYY